LDTSNLFNLLLVIYLLIFSAFFSSAEVAFFLLDNEKLEKLKQNFVKNKITYLLKNPKQLLITILLGNSLVAVALAIVSLNLFRNLLTPYFGISYIVTLQVIIITILVLIFGEISPKVIATKNPLLLAKLYALPLTLIFLIFYPVTHIIASLMEYFTRKISYLKVKKNINNLELEEIADIGKEHGALDENETNLLQGFFSFIEVPVKKILTPRVDIVAIDVNTKFEEIKNLIIQTRHSRIPVYRDNIDNIIGILYAKDILSFINNKDMDNFDLEKIIRPAYFIPEYKLINELLNEFQEKKIHIGIVVDEYGGTLGMVTFTDIIREIVGEIAYENDEHQTESPIKISDNTYSVPGDTTIDEFEELLNIKLKSDESDFETVAGFILSYVGDIPKQGHAFEYNGLVFKIDKIQKNRILNTIVIDNRAKEDDN